jgi:hypothetical protein
MHCTAIVKPGEWIMMLCENEIHFFPPSIPVDNIHLSIHLRDEPHDTQVVNRNIEFRTVARFARLPYSIECLLAVVVE